VASGGARRGRRDNGLVAAVYAAAGDVDPRVGEHLLDVLGLRGIAAYLQPAADLHPVTRTTTLPSRPTDRLYVDREHLGTARDYIAQLTEAEQPSKASAEESVSPAGDKAPRVGAATSAPGQRGQDPDSVDAAFAGIIAGLEEQFGADVPAWPADPDAPERHTPGGGLARWSASTVEPAEEPSLLDGLDTFGADLPDEEEDEGYTPPPPPPLPRISLAAVLGILSIIGGLVIFFKPGLIPISWNLAMLLGFGGILAGFVTLIWRLRSGDEDDDHWDPDDGAVV
jgi:hypothetical protein